MANGEWPTYGGDIGGTKYSPLDQIDRTNFADLEIDTIHRSCANGNQLIKHWLVEGTKRD